MASSTIGLCTKCSRSLFESVENDQIVAATPCGHLYHSTCFSRIFDQADGPPGDPLPPPCSATECNSNMVSSLTIKVKVMRVNLEAVASKSDEFVRLLQQQVQSSQVEMAKLKADLFSSQFEVRDITKKLERANSEAKCWKDKYNQLLATVREQNPELVNIDSKIQSLKQAPPNLVGNTESVNILGADMSVPPPVLHPTVPGPNLANVQQPNPGPANFPLRNIRPPLRLPLRPPFRLPPPHLLKWPPTVEPPTVRGLLMRAMGPPLPKLIKAQRKMQRQQAKKQAAAAKEDAKFAAKIQNHKQAALKYKLVRDNASTNSPGADMSVRPHVNQKADVVLSEIELPPGSPEVQKKNPETANITSKDQSDKKAPPNVVRETESVNNSRADLSPIWSSEGQDTKDVVQPKMSPPSNVQLSSSIDHKQFDLPPWLRTNPATASVSLGPRNEMVDSSNSNAKHCQEDTRQHRSPSDTERRSETNWSAEAASVSPNSRNCQDDTRQHRSPSDTERNRSETNWRAEAARVSPDFRNYQDDTRRHRSPSDTNRRSETKWRAEAASVSPDSRNYQDDTRRHRSPSDTNRRSETKWRAEAASVSPDSRNYEDDTHRYRSPSDTEQRFKTKWREPRDACSARRKRTRSRDSDSSVEQLPYHLHTEEKDYGERKYSKYVPTESVEQLSYRPRTRMRKKDYVGKKHSNHVPPESLEYIPHQHRTCVNEYGGSKHLPTEAEMYPFLKIEGMTGGFVRSRYRKVVGFFAARWLVIGEGCPQAAISLTVAKKHHAQELEQDSTLLGFHLSMEKLMNACRSFVILPPNIVMSVGCAELISGVEVDEMSSLFDELVTLLLNRGVCDIVVTPPIFIPDLEPLRRQYIEVFRNYQPPRGLRFTYLVKMEPLVSSFKRKVDTKGRYCYSAANGRKFGRELLLELNKMVRELDSDRGSNGSGRS